MRGDFDLESGTLKRTRKRRKSVPIFFRTPNFMGNLLRHHCNIHPFLVLFTCFSVVTILILTSIYMSPFSSLSTNIHKINMDSDNFPFPNLSNLVMVAGHSVYTSPNCGKADEEESWFLEIYQKRLGQAATFVNHIQKGVEIAAKDDKALLLFSGGETRKDAGPRSEAQSYWSVADSQGWFGEEENIRWRALTEEHARDSFENLLFSICRFRELTGTYPYNITVVSYDFKEERFVELHRSAIRFPNTRFFYAGTPVLSDSKLEATKGEALTKVQFKDDPYGCLGSLRRKRLGRNPFRRTIPYPDGCPEIEGLFGYCDSASYSGFLPWG